MASPVGGGWRGVLRGRTTTRCGGRGPGRARRACAVGRGVEWVRRHGPRGTPGSRGRAGGVRRGGRSRGHVLAGGSVVEGGEAVEVVGVVAEALGGGPAAGGGLLGAFAAPVCDAVQPLGFGGVLVGGEVGGRVALLAAELPAAVGETLRGVGVDAGVTVEVSTRDLVVRREGVVVTHQDSCGVA